MTVSIASHCTACGACVSTCPEKALRPSPLRPSVDPDRCTDCFECIEVCPADAVHARATMRRP